MNLPALPTAKFDVFAPDDYHDHRQQPETTGHCPNRLALSFATIEQAKYFLADLQATIQLSEDQEFPGVVHFLEGRLQGDYQPGMTTAPEVVSGP